MGDGAHQGVDAERALETILGGKDQPEEGEKLTPEQMLDKIREQPFENLDYSGSSTACARLILEAYERYPELREVPTETIYLKHADGQYVQVAGGAGLVALSADLHGVLKRLHCEESEKLEILRGLTGFMWGWAVNSVRYALGDPPKPNPAIVEF